MRKSENDCVGCSNGCRNCGRKRSFRVYCDRCGEEIPTDEAYGLPEVVSEKLVAFRTSGADYCGTCLLELCRKPVIVIA